VIADGMGGHNAGEVASRLAVDAVVEYVRLRSASLARERHLEYWPFGFDPALSADGNLLRTAIPPRQRANPGSGDCLE